MLSSSFTVIQQQPYPTHSAPRSRRLRRLVIEIPLFDFQNLAAMYTRLAMAPHNVHTAGMAKYSANANLNPNPKLTSSVAGGLFPYAVFTPTPIPSLAKVPIRPWPIRSYVVFRIVLFTERPHCLQYRHAVLSALAELLVWHRQGLVQSPEYCLTHAITHRPPKTDPPCSAVSLRQLSYLYYSVTCLNISYLHELLDEL